jgi:hypothetical protein
VDENLADVTAFRQRHPEVPSSTRVAESAAWFRELGLAGEPPIPIHVFVSPAGKIRCVRAGGVREQDYAVVEKLFTE